MEDVDRTGGGSPKEGQVPDIKDLSSPELIAKAGEAVYARIRDQLLESSPGQFVAIDVTTEEWYVDIDSAEALRAARKAAPSGVFHLIRIGSPTAFQGGFFLTHANDSLQV